MSWARHLTLKMRRVLEEGIQGKPKIVLLRIGVAGRPILRNQRCTKKSPRMGRGSGRGKLPARIYDATANR